MKKLFLIVVALVFMGVGCSRQLQVKTDIQTCKKIWLINGGGSYSDGICSFDYLRDEKLIQILVDLREKDNKRITTLEDRLNQLIEAGGYVEWTEKTNCNQIDIILEGKSYPITRQHCTEKTYLTNDPDKKRWLEECVLPNGDNVAEYLQKALEVSRITDSRGIVKSRIASCQALKNKLGL